MDEYEIRHTEEFGKWLHSVKDPHARGKLVRRLERAKRGNFGDVKPVGEGVYEMREFWGPGWRMYYTKRGKTIVLMLGGGDKSTQDKDIKKAIELSKRIK